MGGRPWRHSIGDRAQNPFAIIAVAIAAVVGALVFLQVKFNIFGQAWNAITAVGRSSYWFSGVFGALGQVVSGFVSGVVWL